MGEPPDRRTAGEFDEARSGLWTRSLLIRRTIVDGDLAFFATWLRQGPAIPVIQDLGQTDSSEPDAGAEASAARRNNLTGPRPAPPGLSFLHDVMRLLFSMQHQILRGNSPPHRVALFPVECEPFFRNRSNFVSRFRVGSRTPSGASWAANNQPQIFEKHR